MLLSGNVVQDVPCNQNLSQINRLGYQEICPNVVDDVVSSQGVVAENALSMLWSGMDMSLDLFLDKLAGRNFREKRKMQSDKDWLTKHI